jgi:integrase
MRTGNAPLTDTRVRAELRRDHSKQVDLPDGTVAGLTLRLSRGAATWSFRYRVPGDGGVTARGFRKKGERYRLSLGTYPAKTIAAARAEAAAHLLALEKGANPVSKLEDSATAGGVAVESLSSKFLTDYVYSKELRSARKIEQAIRVHIVPRVGQVVADALTREQVRALMQKVRVRIEVPQTTARRRGMPAHGGTEAARTSLGVLRRMFVWGMRERLLKRPDNPVSYVAENLPKKRQKDRVLSTVEARSAWRAAATLGYPFGHCFQLLMLTGCRRGEWANAKWSWVDFKESLLVIPAESYKSEHVHVVPLVPQAMELLEEIQQGFRGRAGDYILSGTDGYKPIGAWTGAQRRMMRALVAETGEMPKVPWTPHDLRRTVATRIAEATGLGGEQLVRRVLGHSDGSVTAIYNRYSYIKEIRQALETWAVDLTNHRI